MNTREQIIELLKIGKTPLEIREAMPNQIPHSSAITVVRKRLGMPPFKSGRRPSIDVSNIEKQARKLKESGVSYSDIGKQFGVSRQRIQQLMKPDISRVGNCADCGIFRIALHFHHTNYLTDDGVLLCQSCHRRRHFKYRNLPPKKLLHVRDWKIRRKLTEEQVVEILNHPKKYGQIWDMCQKYGVSESCISRLRSKNRKCYKWVEPSPTLKMAEITPNANSGREL